MTDFEKIIKVTRMAKKNAARASRIEFSPNNLQDNLMGVAGSLVTTWFDIKCIKGLFSDSHDTVVALSWYDTVFQMRMN